MIGPFFALILLKEFGLNYYAALGLTAVGVTLLGVEWSDW